MSPPKLTQYYPGGTAKQLLDFASDLGAGAEPTLSQGAPGGPVKQIIDYADPVVTEANPTLDQYAAGGPAGQIVDWMATAEGGGSGDWTPKIVAFDANTFLRIAALAAADSPYFIFSTFVRILSEGSHEAVLIDFDPANEESRVSIDFRNSSGAIRLPFDDTAESGDNTFFSANGTFGYGTTLHSLVISRDFNHATGEKLCAVYLDRVKVSDPRGRDTTVGAFSYTFSGKTVGIPDTDEDYSTIVPMELGVYQLYTGVKIVEADNTITEDNLNKFVNPDNTPVNPAVAIAAFGTPKILHDGDSTGFAENQGTGGAAVLTGALVDSAIDETLVPVVITSSPADTAASGAMLAHALTADVSAAWTIVAGDDQAQFELSGSTLRWVANGTQDYSTPMDVGNNNIYLVTVRGTGGDGGYSEQTVAVTVTA